MRQCVCAAVCQRRSLLCLLGRCERLAPAWFACHLCPCRCRDLHVERPTTYQTPLLVAGHGAHPLGRSAATVALQWFSCPIPSTAGDPTGLERRSPHRLLAALSLLLPVSTRALLLPCPLSWGTGGSAGGSGSGQQQLHRRKLICSPHPLLLARSLSTHQLFI